MYNMTYLLLFFVSVSTAQAIDMMMPPGTNQFGSMPSMGDMASFEEQLMQEIDMYVKSLPQEEQDAFYRAVEEETAKIENMDEAELNKYIEDTFKEIEQPLAAPTKSTSPSKSTKSAEKSTAPKAPKEVKISEEEARALALINSAITHINAYLLKINSMPEMSMKLPKWGQQERIAGWKKDLSFNSYKKDVELLNQALHTLKTKDPKTNEYPYLNDFIKNKSLYDNVVQFNKKIEASEPHIKLRTLEFEKIDIKSKKAAIEATTALLEAIQQMNITKSVEEIVTKHEPTFKKRKEEQEREAKKAQDESKRIIRPTATTSGGYGAGQRGTKKPIDYGFTHKATPRSSGYSGGSYGGYSGDYGRSSGYEAPSPASRSFQGKPSGRGSSSSGYGASFDKPTKAGSDTRTRDHLSKAQAKDDNTQKNKVESKKKPISDTVLRRVYAVADGLEDGLKQLGNAGLLKPSLIIINTKQPQSEEVKIQLNSARKAEAYFKDALNGIRRIGTQAKPEQRKQYANKLQNIIKEYDKELKNFKDDIIKTKKKAKEISEINKFIYLGGPVPTNMDPKQLEAFGTPFNLIVILDLLVQIQDTIEALAQGQTVVQKKAPIKKAGAKS